MSEPRFVNLTLENLKEHHLCCALGDKKHLTGVANKKVWLAQRFSEGLVFRKLDVRGKVFIEYMPAEFAWRPIVAPTAMAIHCLWVSGRYAKHGYAQSLLDYCLKDTEDRGLEGVVVACAKRKRPFLSDAKFFKHQGFTVLDEHEQYLLLGRAFGAATLKASFAPSVHTPSPTTQGSFVASFTDQCPFNQHWSQQLATNLRELGQPVQLRHLTSVEQAQSVCSPLGTFGLQRNGELLSHHLTTEKATKQLVDKALKT